ncbi:MAG: DNA-3-methyladenine glycosylase family protein [Planctomycetota bacterium]|jgi:DNA-3-methyladenine glycosylase II
MHRPANAALGRLKRADPRLAAALARVGPFPGFPQRSDRRVRTHYESLARAIVFQQLAGKAAATIHSRVCALSPHGRFPRPDELLALPESRLRTAGLSRNKLAALRDLAVRIVERRLVLAALGRRSDEEIIERLVEVRGIGPWSAQMFLIFRLGRLDVMPADDLGVREGLRRLDGLEERPTPAAVRERAEAWVPLRSVAAWTLWRVADGEAWD